MARYQQPTFARGEIDPAAHGRIDLALYLTGLHTCRNFFVRTFGGVRKRPGMQFIGELPMPGWLIPFRFSRDDSYVLAFFENSMRIIRNGGFVADPETGDIVTIASPFDVDELPAVKYVQDAGVMTLVHPNRSPHELRRIDHHDWEFTEKRFLPTIAAPGQPTATAKRDWDISGESYTNAYVVTAIVDQTGDESFPSPEVEVTAQGDLGTIQRQTTSPVDVLTITNSNAISWPAVAGADRYSVYKKRNGIFGLIGTTEALSLTDDDINPDLAQQPPRNRDPFEDDDFPGAVGRFQQRLFFGGKEGDPEGYEASQTGREDNFGVNAPLRDDDAIQAAVRGQEVSGIRHFVTLKNKLLILTDSVEWVLNVADNGLTPSLEGGQAEETRYGSTDVRPLLIDDAVLWVRDGGDEILEGIFDLGSGLVVNEATLLSRHLLFGRKVVDMAYAKVPWRVVAIVLDDGTALLFAYHRSQQVYGLSRIDTRGTIRSVASIREGDRDVFYFQTERAGAQFVERMDFVDDSDPRDSLYVDAGLRFDNPVTVTSAAVDGFPTLNVGAGGSGFSLGDVVEWSGVTTLNADGDEIPHPLNDLRFRVIGNNNSILTLDFEYPLDDPPDRPEVASLGVVRRTAEIFSGLDHLEGRTVAILADGGELEPRPVVDGAIKLDVSAARVAVGLPYVSELQTLPIPGDAEIRSRKKRLAEMQVQTRRTRGLKAYPPARPDLVNELKAPEQPRRNEARQLQNQSVNFSIASNWSIDGMIAIRHDYPLPCEILRITPVFDVGG